MVVVVGHAEVALVLRLVVVGVTDERGLPVIVELGVRDGDEVSGVGQIEKTVVVVLVVVAIGREIEVVQPNVGGLLDGNSITADNLLEGQVLDDNILLALNGESKVLKNDRAVLAADGLVRCDLDVVAVALDAGGDGDLGSTLSLHSGVKLRKRSNLDGRTTSSTSGASVLGGIADRTSGTLLDGGRRCQSEGGKAEREERRKLHGFD